MKIINVDQDYNLFRLEQERHINELISRIENDGGLGIETELEINIEECTTDYPATPKLLDYFLEHLSNQRGKKMLTVKLNGLGNKESYILCTLVLEGNFFSIYDKIDKEEDIGRWKEVINKILKDKEIVLQVIYTPEQKKYIYGN
jgi:hypothetical protein